MCGIAGIVGRGANDARVQAMCRRLLHRGPDGAGVWSADGAVLGHRRLAILDLSDAGLQPMVRGAHALTYNGELYNYRELRAELPGPFESHSDTEVLLQLLARDGLRCLARLAGMFAFAFWDAPNRRLLAARDRVGMKPFYYRELDQGLAFASELKALLELGVPAIDRSAVRDFLLHGYIPAPKTIYAGIRKLPAGHCLTWMDGKLAIERYWTSPAEIQPRSEDETLEQLDAILRQVVPEHTLADVPVGVFLSGGIDSAVTAFYLDRPRTFTLGFDVKERSEADAARALAAHLHTQHTELTATAGDLELALATTTEIFDEPFGDSAAWPNFLIAKAARREVKVALSGEGGDEIFCGYPRYWSEIGHRSSLFNRALAGSLPVLSRWGQSMQRRALVGLPAAAAALGGLTSMQVDALLADGWRDADYDYNWFYRQFWREDLAPLARLRWLDLHTNLAEGLLTKVDRSSMANSLEVRPPLLDHRLVEFMLSVDPQLLVDRQRRRGKVLVRRLMEPRLPRGYLDRPKSGFSFPVHRWLRRHPQLFRNASARLRERGVLRADVSIEFRRAWYLMVLDAWFTRYA
jgi:asparagine synthase (glutamine-hydrolysing)